MDTPECQESESSDITATTLQIVSHVHVTPLLHIQHPPFARLHRDGVYCSLFTERCSSPLSDHHLLENIRATLQETDVNGQHTSWLPTLGFHFGRLHGTILSPQTGQLRPDVTALAHFEDDQARRGYDVGQQWYFIDALIEQPNDRTYTDASLIERLQEIERESLHFHEEIDTWYHALGCILGELSGQVFPATNEETARWERERCDWAVQAS